MKDWTDWKVLLPSGALICILVLGYIYAWPTWAHGLLKPDYGFLQNLLSEGTGALVTTLIIVPLTSYVVSKRRDRERFAARESFFSEMDRRLKRLHFDFVTIAGRFSIAKLTLETAGAGPYFKKMDAMFKDPFGEHHDTKIDKSEFLKDPDIFHAIAVVHSAIIDFEKVERRLSSIASLIDVYLPLIPQQAVADVAYINWKLEDGLNSFRYLRLYSLGTATKGERALAKHAHIIFLDIGNSFKSACNKAGFPKCFSQAQALLDRPIDTDFQKVVEQLSKTLDTMLYQD